MSGDRAPGTRRAHRAQRATFTAVAAVAVMASLVAVGCGIPTDSAPREIPEDVVPDALRATTSTIDAVDDPATTRRQTVFLVQTGAADAADALVPVVVPVVRPADRRDLPRIVADAVIAANPTTLGRPDLLNALPAGMVVLRADLGDDGVLDLDVTELDTVEGSLQRLAVAQLVFSLTGLSDPRVDAVRFAVDGELVAVPVERGSVPAGVPVSRADDLGLLAGLRARTPRD